MVGYLDEIYCSLFIVLFGQIRLLNFFHICLLYFEQLAFHHPLLDLLFLLIVDSYIRLLHAHEITLFGKEALC